MEFSIVSRWNVSQSFFRPRRQIYRMQKIMQHKRRRSKWTEWVSASAFIFSRAECFPRRNIVIVMFVADAADCICVMWLRKKCSDVRTQMCHFSFVFVRSLFLFINKNTFFAVASLIKRNHVFSWHMRLKVLSDCTVKNWLEVWWETFDLVWIFYAIVKVQIIELLRK